MSWNDFKDVIARLEQQESEAPDGDVPLHIYKQLLCTYMHESDITKTKQLWDRIPSPMKEANPELKNIWIVGQYIEARDFTCAYKALSGTEWSLPVRMVMKQIEDNLRNSALEVIEKVYGALRLETVCTMTGLSPNICAAVCRQRGWKVDSNEGIVHPVVPAGFRPEK